MPGIKRMWPLGSVCEFVHWTIQGWRFRFWPLLSSFLPKTCYLEIINNYIKIKLLSGQIAHGNVLYSFCFVIGVL